MTLALVVLGGALLGGLVSGLAGFGTGVVALGIWLYVLPPAPAATLVALCSVASQAQTIPAIWHAVDGRRAWPMIAAGLAGIPIGTALLSRADPAAFRIAIGLVLLVFSSVMLLGRFRTQLAWGGRPADAVVGFASGILGGLAGLSGPLPTMWATLRGWEKDSRRALFQVFNLVILSAVAAWHLVAGLSGAELGWALLIALPATFVGTWVGARLYRRMSDRSFHEVVLILLAVSGLVLVSTSL